MEKVLVVVIVGSLLMISLFSGCTNTPNNLVQFSIYSFNVDPSIVNQGESANLSWVVLGSTSVSIDNGIGSVALTGHRIIYPAQTTTYILTASNATMTKSASITITVNTPANESRETQDISIVSFEVTPSVINLGETANLTWTVTGATSIIIDKGIGSVALSGHRTIVPSGTTMYTLTASNPSTNKVATVQVFVRSEQPSLPQQTPNIACTTDSTNNKMTVATADAGVQWSDIVITLNPSANYDYQVWYNGGTTPASSLDSTTPPALPTGTTVTAGDYIQLTSTVGGANVLVTLRYVPTNSLLGTWTINV